MYKVSVVVPIYNVEAYIVRCAESLFGQTLDDMQFIFVDDATPDNSVALLEQTLERFPRRKSQTIILHHPKNLGLPTSRATGLARVEAPYVAHCDSDDYVDTAMYARLYETAVRNDSDMVVCGRIIHCTDGREYPELYRPRPDERLICSFLFGNSRFSVWSRLTRTEIYRRVQFPKENYLEDWVQVAQLLTYAKRISYLDEFLYHYVYRPTSITTDMRPELLEDKLQQCVANFYLMHDFIVKHHQVDENMFMFKKQCVRSQFILSARQWRHRKLYLQTFPEINYRLLFDRRVPFHHRAYHLLVLLGLHLISKNIYAFLKQKGLFEFYLVGRRRKNQKKAEGIGTP